MVVVFGGVGNLWGTFTGAFTLGHRQQAARAHAWARCWPRSWSWSRSSCSSRSGRAGCSRSRAARWRAEPMLKAFPAATWIVVPLLLLAAVLVPMLNLAPIPPSALRMCRPTWSACSASICASRILALSARSGLGLLRHPQPRPRRLLRARRLRHGHVPDAPDRRPRRLRQPGAARLHGVPELAGAALVLARLRHVLVRHADGDPGAGRCSPSSSAGSPSAAGSPASISRSSPRR